MPQGYSKVSILILTILTVIVVPLLVVPLVLLVWRLVFRRRQDAAVRQRIANRHAAALTDTSSADWPKMSTLHVERGEHHSSPAATPDLEAGMLEDDGIDRSQDRPLVMTPWTSTMPMSCWKVAPHAQEQPESSSQDLTQALGRPHWLQCVGPRHISGGLPTESTPLTPIPESVASDNVRVAVLVRMPSHERKADLKKRGDGRREERLPDMEVGVVDVHAQEGLRACLETS
ncbi:hypothetical protein L226DRAFT_572766 [Lentinus tigrinus ALCF2SS1-7]|nr:hypothetical protein L226DRAFT_572766 [Lentinus tigrinus ALCF2SS1-7]